MTKAKVAYTPDHVATATQVLNMSRPELDWEDKGLCVRRGVSTVAPEGVTLTERRRYEDAVIQMSCGKCVVRDACLHAGVVRRDTASVNVYGGKRSEDIRKIRLAYSDLRDGTIQAPEGAPVAEAAVGAAAVEAAVQPVAEAA